MSEVNSSFLLSRQAFGRKNCGLVGRHFLTLMEPNGPSHRVPPGRKWQAVHLVEDRDHCRKLPRNARFCGQAFGSAFLHLKASLVVLFEPDGGPRVGEGFRDEIQNAAAAALLAADGDAAVVKTTTDRLGFWEETFEMYAPRDCILLRTDWGGVGQTVRLCLRAAA